VFNILLIWATVNNMCAIFYFINLHRSQDPNLDPLARLRIPQKARSISSTQLAKLEMQ
jgi:hypothetical protein